MSTNKRVVIVGGNYAGSSVAQGLKGKAGVDVTVIDSRDYWENSVATPKMLTSGEPLVKQALRPHSGHFQGATFVQGEVTGVTKEAVSVGEQTIPFDFLVLATGAAYAFFKDFTHSKLEDRSQQILEEVEKVKAAKSVAVVGAGVVGLECVGEIKEAWPDKTVTLISSGGILPGANDKGVAAVTKRLNDLGVKTVLNQRAALADWTPGAELKTESGESLGATDHVIKAVGGWNPSTGFLKGGFLGEALNEKGEIQIEPTQLVKGHANIFAIGDCATHPERPNVFMRSGNYATEQGKAVAKSILALAKNPSAKLKPFSFFKAGGFTMGPSFGIAFNGKGEKLSLGWGLRKMKGEDWWTAEMAGRAGLPKKI